MQQSHNCCIFFYIHHSDYVKYLQKHKVFRLNILIFATAKNKYATMKIKNSRLDAIRLILSTQEIGSQEELLNELEKEGFKLTQATLSRDLHQLRVVKTVGTQGRYRYVLTRPHQYRHAGEQGEVRGDNPAGSKRVPLNKVFGQYCRNTYQTKLCKHACIPHRQL